MDEEEEKEELALLEITTRDCGGVVRSSFEMRMRRCRRTASRGLLVIVYECSGDFFVELGIASWDYIGN